MARRAQKTAARGAQKTPRARGTRGTEDTKGAGPEGRPNPKVTMSTYRNKKRKARQV